MHRPRHTLVVKCCENSCFGDGKKPVFAGVISGHGAVGWVVQADQSGPSGGLGRPDPPALVRLLDRPPVTAAKWRLGGMMPLTQAGSSEQSEMNCGQGAKQSGDRGVNGGLGWIGVRHGWGRVSAHGLSRCV